MPKIDFSYLTRKFEEQKSLEIRLSKQERIIKTLETRIVEMTTEKENQEIKQNSLISELSKQITELTNEINNIKKETQEKLDKQIKISEQEKLLQQQKFEQLETRLKKQEKEQNETFKESFEKLSEKVEEQNAKFFIIEEKINSDNHINQSQTIIQPFKAEISLKMPRILSRLKKNEKTPFNRFYIASQSSADIYNLIDPKTNDQFYLTDVGKYFEIELKDIVVINAIKIFSSSEYFPKSFDIVINDQKIKSVTNATELNGQYKSIIIKFNAIQCQKIRIISKGSNWDKEDNFICFKRIELLSPNEKYIRGVFTTLVSSCENAQLLCLHLILTLNHFT